MQETWNTSQFVLHNATFLYSPEQVVIHLEAVFRETLEPPLLWQALDAVMRRTDYLFLKPVRDGDNYGFSFNEQPCLLYAGDQVRRMPDETNGYLFYACHNGRVLHLYGLHSLMDGNGMIRVLKELVKEYCSRRYHLSIPLLPLWTSPPIFQEEMELLKEYRMPPRERRVCFPDTQGSVMKRTLVTLDKEQVVRKAVGMGVKPFSYLFYMLCQSTRRSLQTDDFSASLPIDVRTVIGRPNALYNAVIPWNFNYPKSATGENVLLRIDQLVKDVTDEDAKKAIFAELMRVYEDIYQMKRPLKAKITANRMMTQLAGANAMLSYLGTPFTKEESGLLSVLQSLRLWVTGYNVPALVEEITLNGQMLLCFSDQSKNADTAECFCGELARDGITPCDVETPDG